MNAQPQSEGRKFLLVAFAYIILFLCSSSKTFAQSAPSGYVSVMAYGTKGDGKTDESDAIDRAVEAANAANKGVYFPNGNYLHLQPIFTNVNFMGAGAGTTLIAGDPENDCGIMVVGKNVTLSNFSVGDVTAFDSGGGYTPLPFPDFGQGPLIYGISVYSAQAVNLTNISFKNMRWWGLGVVQSQNVAITNCNFGAQTPRGAGGGMVIINSSTVGVYNSQFSLNGVSITGIQYSSTLAINNNSFTDSAAVIGLRLNDSQFNYNTFTSIQGPGYSNFQFYNGPIANIQIKGNYFGKQAGEVPTLVGPLYAILFVNQLDLYSGIWINGIEISDNNMDGIGNIAPVKFYGAAGNVSIVNNTMNNIGGFAEGEGAISMHNAANAYIAQNTITNTARGPAITFKPQSVISQVCSVTIYNNSFKDIWTFWRYGDLDPVVQIDAGPYSSGPVVVNNNYLGGILGQPQYFIYCDQTGAIASGNVGGTLPSYYNGGAKPPDNGGGGSGGAAPSPPPAGKHGLPYVGNPHYYFGKVRVPIIRFRTIRQRPVIIKPPKFKTKGG